MKDLKQLLEQKAGVLREFWFDVDGVMTPQGAITIYDVREGADFRYFERKDGIISTRLVPCDEYGVPIMDVIEYIAGYEGEPIMEGYRFDPRDGKVVEYLVENHFPVYFVSGRNSPCVRKRAIALGAIPLLGVKNKLVAMKDRATCELGEILFIGDGIQDCEALSAVGVSIAPSDASTEAIAAAQAVTETYGGGGVLNEVTTLFLKERKLWPA
jgi:YrbI family 3-deoxy-D-manno-octulosonate 8-phosphate phosphatase